MTENIPDTPFNAAHDAFDIFMEKTDVKSLHRSIYNTFFDYLKTAPPTDTYAFKQASTDIYALLEFLKEIEHIKKATHH